MIQENRLIEKTYYETLLTEDDNIHPIDELGQAYYEEQKNEVYDLSYIRYAQGEVYYHCKDFETAIFKWGNIENELEPWAKKNIGDAYYELGFLSSAEEVYTSIQTEHQVLQIEVALQLFSLYVKRNKRELAYEEIEKAIRLDPDYPNVTAIAKGFYEDQEDWEKAVQLAIQEAVRTEDLEWFSTVNRYVENGYIGRFNPEAFYSLLICVYRVDRRHFIKMTSLLWDHFRQRDDAYLEWVRTVNDIFLNIEVELYDAWHHISALYQNTYNELTEGAFSTKDLTNVMPNLLGNWLKVSTTKGALPVAAAILAWHDVFPSSISDNIVEEAEHLLSQVREESITLEETIQLFSQIEKWAENNHLEIGFKLKWLVHQIAHSNEKHIVVAGLDGSGKSTFIQSLIGEKLWNDTESNLLFIQHRDEKSITEISNSGERSLTDCLENSSNHHFLDIKLPSPILHRLGCRLIDTPGLHDDVLSAKEYFEFFALADGILFVLDATQLFSEREMNMLSEMQQFVDGIPIHFLITKMDEIDSGYDSEMIIKNIQEKVELLYPGATVFPYSSVKAVSMQQNDLISFIEKHFQTNKGKEDRNRSEQLLKTIRQVVSKLASQRVEMEKRLTKSIEKNRDIFDRLNGFKNRILDIERESIDASSQSYKQLILDMKATMKKEIPRLLHESSSIVSEDSDFKRLHLELNEKMNEKIQLYLQEEFLPTMKEHLNSWLDVVKEQLTDIQDDFHEMSRTFNALFEEDRLLLSCDFQVLEDWQRDISRMTSRSYIEKENFMLRLNPTQFLLKSAGKLLGALPQNKTLLANQYKKYLERESFSEVTTSVVNKFFLPFEMFERAIEQDLVSFFEKPQENVTNVIHETKEEVEKCEMSLYDMNEHVEAFEEPLTLINVKLRQYEWMKKEDRALSYS